jgi:DNA-binding IclR family transcriptional regulator
MEKLNEKSARVLGAFSRSGYSLRTATGLSKDAQLPKPEVQLALSDLISQGLVQQLANDKGVRFYLTVEGRKADVILNNKAAS